MLTEAYAPECSSNSSSLPTYCSTDTCPDLYNIQQSPPICDNISMFLYMRALPYFLYIYNASFNLESLLGFVTAYKDDAYM